MASPHFVKAMQSAVKGKEKLEEGVAQALRGMNIPTRTEFKKALSKIEALERELAVQKAAVEGLAVKASAERAARSTAAPAAKAPRKKAARKRAAQPKAGQGAPGGWRPRAPRPSWARACCADWLPSGEATRSSRWTWPRRRRRSASAIARST